MRSLASLLATGFLQQLEIIAGHTVEVNVTAIEFAEDASDVLEGFETSGVPESAGRLVVLGRNMSVELAAEMLPEVSLREFASLGVRALILTGGERPQGLMPSSAEMLAQLGLVILSAPSHLKVAELLSHLTSALAGDGAQALRRVTQYLDASAMHQHATSGAPDAGADALLALASRALENTVTLEPGDSIGVAVRLEGTHVGRITSPRRSGVDGLADRIVSELVALHLAGQLSSRELSGARLSADVLLSELIVAAEDHAVRLTQQARSLGLPIDGWHRALVFLPTQPEHLWSPAYFSSLGNAALAALPDPTPWLVTRSEGALILLQSWGEDPRPVAATGDPAGKVLDHLNAHSRASRFRCGVGSVHQGVSGLRVTVAEGRSALGQPSNSPVVRYDQDGLRPIIVDLAHTTASRASARQLLGPILALDSAKAREIIYTLQVYLDEQSSLARAAERLSLHRNSVAYRVRQAKHLLGTELDNAEQRLAMQLACRAYLIDHGGVS